MEGHCSTGQRPQQAVVPMEEKEEKQEEEEAFLDNMTVFSPFVGCRRAVFRTIKYLSTLIKIRNL